MERAERAICFRRGIECRRSHGRTPGAANAGSTPQNSVGDRKISPAVCERRWIRDSESRLHRFGSKAQPMKIHILDTRQLGLAGIVAATALETNDGIALFDTGPESTFDNVVVDLRKHGFAAEDVRHVFLSHIHFDHAGAAWRFAESASPARTGATVYVH